MGESTAPIIKIEPDELRPIKWDDDK